MATAKNPKPKEWLLEKGQPGEDRSPKTYVSSTSARDAVINDLEAWIEHVRAYEPERLDQFLDDVGTVSRMDSEHFDCQVLVDGHTGFVYRARITRIPVPAKLVGTK